MNTQDTLSASANETNATPAAAADYGRDYYRHALGAVPYDRDQPAIMGHFRAAAHALVERFAPRNVLDVGCAKGFLVEHLRDLGVDAAGIDGSAYALSAVRDDVKPYCRQASALEPFGGRYDLITCIEVAEHLDEQDAPRLVENLCAHADTVLFSSTPLDFAEVTHFNVQPPEYWKELFARCGFYPDLRFDPHVVTPQAMVFRKVTRPLRVALFSKEKANWAVVRLRTLDPLRELERQGRMQVAFVSPYEQEIDVEALLTADLFVVGREFADETYSREIVEVARSLGKPIVFELDDLLTKVPRSNPVFEYCTRIAPDMEKMVRTADFVTVSTEPLKQELQEIDPTVAERAFVLRNCVNPAIWGGEFPERMPPADGAPLVVGWFGSPTHQEDLEIVGEAIAYLARRHAGRIEFHFFGYMPKEFRDVPGAKLVRGPQADVVRHAKGVRDARIDVAIAPLTDHPFNHSKSDLKWLEYSICGIPGIYSNVTPYASSIVHGVNGLLAENTTASWVAAIEAMLGDDELRESIARRAFDEVRGGYCIDTRAVAWDDLYRTFVASGARRPAPREQDLEAAASRAAALLFRFQARLQSKNGGVAEAVKSLEAALELDPGLASDAVIAGCTLAERGHLAAADRLLASALAAAPSDAGAARALAALRAAVGDVIGAERVFEFAARENAGEPELAMAHAEHLAATGRAQEIAERLAPVVDEAGAEAVVPLVEKLMALDRSREALRIAEHARRVHPAAGFDPLVTSLRTFVGRAPAPVAPSRKRAGGSGGSGSPGEPLKVGVFTLEPLSGARVHRRLRAPLRVLERSRQAEVIFSDGVHFAAAAGDADVAVLQRAFAASNRAAAVVAAARKNGAKVVFEADDLWFVDDAADPARRERVLRCMREADAVTVPTAALKDALAERVPEARQRIHVLETPLDVETWSSVARWPDPALADRPLNVGLFHGAALTEEVRAIAAALSPLIAKSRGTMTLTQWTPEVDAGAPLATARSVGAATPVYVEYAHRLQSRPVDVALLPVSDDARCTTTSGAAWLELAACRAPAVCSAREPFASLVAPGATGFLLAGGPDAWVEAVRQLAGHPKLRREIGERAWTHVLASRTAQQQAHRWLALYRSLAHGTAAAESAASAGAPARAHAAR